ncbi:MAG: hypothetical protein Q7U75_05950, partial [Desulfobacterales bacterium]|nr:hypothetical protein [Desulfobacterales bacterium]
MPITPSTDPDVRDYRIRLLPQVMTPHRRFIIPPQLIAILTTVSERILINGVSNRRLPVGVGIMVAHN